MDLSESMLKYAQIRKKEKRLKQLELVQVDMDNLPDKENTFDLIFSRFSLMYSVNIEQVIKTLGNFLLKGGEILAEVNVAVAQDETEKINFKGKLFPLKLTMGDKEFKLKNFIYSAEAYKNAIESAELNLKVVEQFPTDELTIDDHYLNQNKIKFSCLVFGAKKDKY